MTVLIQGGLAVCILQTLLGAYGSLRVVALLGTGLFVIILVVMVIYTSAGEWVVSFVIAAIVLLVAGFWGTRRISARPT